MSPNLQTNLGPLAKQIGNVTQTRELELDTFTKTVTGEIERWV